MISTPSSAAELDRLMSEPSPGALDVVRAAAEEGDFAVLGAGGKMGFHLCLMLQRALKELGLAGERKVSAVSRFRSAEARGRFEAAGFNVVAADLSEEGEVDGLDLCANVFFLAGVKFGTDSDSDLLARMNIVMPGLVAKRFRESRIVALSTGCVYSFTNPEAGGSNEESETDPPGEYAASCQGREQAFVDAAAENGTRSTLVRLNYSIDLRYGVLVDIAQKVLAGEPVNVDMGYVNLIWQGDAVDQIVQCLGQVGAPPTIMNVAGREILRVRKLAAGFGERFGREVTITGEEGPTAWMSDPSKGHAIFGEPRVSLEEMLDCVAGWLENGGETLDKPTRFENREGNY